MKRCQICLGQKTILGMGHIRENCTHCNGKGFIIDVIKPKQEKIKNVKKGSEQGRSKYNEQKGTDI